GDRAAIIDRLSHPKRSRGLVLCRQVGLNAGPLFYTGSPTMSISRRRFTSLTAAAIAAMTVQSRALQAAARELGLKDAFKDDFLVGTAINKWTLERDDATQRELIAREFNSITAENCMKWMEIHPEEDRW